MFLLKEICRNVKGKKELEKEIHVQDKHRLLQIEKSFYSF